MNHSPATTASFTGHRDYDGSAGDALRRTVGELYARGYRAFMSGMAVGFDLAAAEAVLDCRRSMPGVRLIAVVPFQGQESRFSTTDRECFSRILAAADEVVVLSPVFHRGCYTVRNDFLVDSASAVIAWYDGSPGGTHYTVRRARRFGKELIYLHPDTPRPEPTLF